MSSAPARFVLRAIAFPQLLSDYGTNVQITELD